MNKDCLLIEMADDELHLINGGGFWAGVVIGAVVCVACDVGNEVLKNKTGKDVGDWATYYVGYAVNKVGQWFSYAGNAIN